MTATAALAAFASRFEVGEAPSVVIDHIELDLADTIGVAVAARGERVARDVAEFVVSAGTGGPCTLWATGENASPTGAAFANAVLVRALDYDDIYDRGPVHAGAAVLPAVLAIAEHRVPTTTVDLLAGLLVGTEIGCRLGDAAAVAEGGRRPSALASQIAGYFAAAAAAARAARLDERATAHALGLALAQAAGSMAVVAKQSADGKALYMGLSSEGGIRSALLAAAGIELGGDPIGGRDGLFERHFGAEAPLDNLIGGLGSDFRLLGLGFKPWPGTKVGHPFIEAALDLRSRLGADAVTVAKIEVEVGRWGKLFSEADDRARPESASSARNSVPWLIACALVRGEVGIESFEPASLGDPLLHGCAARVRTTYRPELSSDLPYESGVVRVTLADGSVHSVSVEVPLGDRRRPLRRERIERKLRDCCSRGERTGSPADATAILDAISELPRISDAGALLAAIVPRVGMER